MRFLFHGAGSANLGSANLLTEEGGVPRDAVFCTNSRGLVWKSEDGSEGSFRNDEQKGVAVTGKPSCGTDLVSIINYLKPDALIGAVGVSPGCFTKDVIDAMLAVQKGKPDGGMRPLIMALSNPKTQAEITAKQCYDFSDGRCIYGSGTRFEPEVVNGKVREPGQVNNFFIFPGMSFGAMCCECSTMPERLFMVAAETVANSLDEMDIEAESVVPNPMRIREVGDAVSTSVVLEAQKLGLAGKPLGATKEEVSAELQKRAWTPSEVAGIPKMTIQAKVEKMENVASNYGEYQITGA
jgi:malate dehydrogenase (oxaloacetate-decarboxylating)(NADP+)